MGSFLMSCAVTGSAIPEGAEVVAFPMSLEMPNGRGDSADFNQNWFISGMPIFGVYNDYGDVLEHETNIEHNSSKLDLMIVHKWAWEYLMEIVKKYNDEEDALYVEYNKQGLGYINYRLQRQQKVREAIDFFTSQQDHIPVFMNLTPEKLKEVNAEMVVNSLKEMRHRGNMDWFGEGSRNADDHWRNFILKSENPHKTCDDFYKYIISMSHAKHMIFFRMMPSMYASQEYNHNILKGLYERGLKYCNEEIAKDHEDE